MLGLAVALLGVAAPAQAGSAHNVRVTDQVREPGTSHVDVARAVLKNGRTAIEVRLRFRTLKLASLREVVVGIDVNASSPGYLVRVRRSGNQVRGTLSTAVLFSDGSTERRITCRGLRIALKGSRTVRVVVPRSCMRVGGNRARFHWFVTDRHGHYDESPWNGTGFSAWTRRAR